MNVDSDTVHIATRLLVASSFLIAVGATAYRRRFGYALFYLLAAVETYAKLRYPASGAARDWLLGSSFTNTAKYSIQLAAFVVAGVVGGLVLLTILRSRRRSGAELTLMLGTLGVVAVLATETISYHYVDVFIYTEQGGIMRSGWLYIVPALVATAGALALRGRR